MKKVIEWLKEEVGELPCVDTVFNSGGSSYIDSAVPVMAVYDLIDQLDEPVVLSQEWIDEHVDYADVRGGTQAFIHVEDLKKPLVPKQEEITEEQVMEWLDNNEFYCHATAETVLANAVDKGELGYYGTKYSVVKKEPETVADVIADFYKSLERLKEVLGTEVEELEE